MKLQRLLLLNTFSSCSLSIVLASALAPQLTAQAMPSTQRTDVKQKDIHATIHSADVESLKLEENLHRQLHSSDSSINLAQTLDIEGLELDQSIIDGSPILQRWLEETPDILEDIRRDPAFRTRIRFAYAEIDGESGVYISVDDIFLGNTKMTLNAGYEETFGDDHQSWGMELRYYTLPLGNRVNLAPLVGYRELETPDDYIDGVEFGLRLLFVPSRTAAADLSVTQSWVNLGNDRQETSLTTFTAGYALTQDVRLSSDIQIQVTPDRQDIHFSLGLEFML